MTPDTAPSTTPGDRPQQRSRVTLRDVARHAGVDVSTVSRVLRKTPDATVGQATRERIQEAASTLGYRPNLMARSLRTARTNCLGIVVPQLDNPVFQQLILAVEETAARHGQTTVIYHMDDQHRPAQTIADLAAANQVDGLIIATRMIADGELGPLQDLACPYVVINESPGTDLTVSFDYTEAARLATDHLLALGHRRIALLNGPRGRLNAERRLTGYNMACDAAGISPDDRFVVEAGFGFKRGRTAMGDLLATATPPTAVVAATLPVGIGALAAAQKAGIRVPDDLSLVAMHDALLAEMVFPQLTTVRFPVAAMGQATVDSLLEILNGSTPSLPLQLEPEGIIERASTAALRGSSN